MLRKAEEEKNFKGLKDELLKIHKKKKKEETKKKVTGEKMLKLLKLDNFNKYENEFLTDSGSPLKKPTSKAKDEKITNQNDQQEECPENLENEKEKEQKKEEENEEMDDSESSLDPKDEYESVDPKTLE